MDRLLEAEARAADPRFDGAAATRIAARVRDRVRAEEEARAPHVTRPVLVRWAWGLGAAIAAHAALFVAIGLRQTDERPPESTDAYVAIPGLGTRGLASTEPSPNDAGTKHPIPPYDDDLLPVERAHLVEPSLQVAIPSPSSATWFSARTARAMAVRSNDSWKRLIESRVEMTGSLDRVKASLDALAGKQAPDGSWPDATGASPGSTTALVLLAFLGDGNSSRGGIHRETVQRGVAWLRGRDADAAGAYGLWVLADDFLLVNGALTPAEGRARSTEIADRAAAVVRNPDPNAPAEALRSALDAASRAGLAARHEALAVAARAGPARDGTGDAWVGSAILRAGQGDEFRAWARTASVRLRDRLGPDGLAKGTAGASDADRILETAALLLALQTPYRAL